MTPTPSTSTSTLRELRKVARRLDQATEAWERLIQQARDEGCTLRDIGDAAGISHVAVSKKTR